MSPEAELEFLRNDTAGLAAENKANADALVAERELSDRLAAALEKLTTDWCAGNLSFVIACGYCPGCEARYALNSWRAARTTKDTE